MKQESVNLYIDNKENKSDIYNELFKLLNTGKSGYADKAKEYITSHNISKDKVEEVVKRKLIEILNSGYIMRYLLEDFPLPESKIEEAFISSSRASELFGYYATHPSLLPKDTNLSKEETYKIMERILNQVLLKPESLNMVIGIFYSYPDLFKNNKNIKLSSNQFAQLFRIGRYFFSNHDEHNKLVLEMMKSLSISEDEKLQIIENVILVHFINNNDYNNFDEIKIRSFLGDFLNDLSFNANEVETLMMYFDKEFKYKKQEDEKKLQQIQENILKRKSHVINLEKKFTKEERKDVIRKKIEKRINKGWDPTWYSAARRAIQEMMPEKKFEAYSRVALAISKKYNIELTRHSLNFSTNREGGHSWYIKIPNINYNPQEINKVDEYNDFVEISNNPELVIKITDHLTNYLQMYTKERIPIIDTYIISDDLKNVNILNNFDNYYRDNIDKYDERILNEIPIDEIEKNINETE